MLTHKFGIMDRAPRLDEYYDDYEPEKYNCVTVNDEIICPLLEEVFNTEMYWHSLKNPGHGLAYCGITLIPPAALDDMINALSPKEGSAELCNLLQKAKVNKKYVIHFGI